MKRNDEKINRRTKEEIGLARKDIEAGFGITHIQLKKKLGLKYKNHNVPTNRSNI
ncbi:hypothetical protein HY990_03050 [Candidatus Micrarchaeota archaeon]|nr:hypothetical protein [Candidatus Micrarchaeota archaeon]